MKQFRFINRPSRVLVSTGEGGWQVRQMCFEMFSWRWQLRWLNRKIVGGWSIERGEQELNAIASALVLTLGPTEWFFCFIWVSFSWRVLQVGKQIFKSTLNSTGNAAAEHTASKWWWHCHIMGQSILNAMKFGEVSVRSTCAFSRHDACRSL